MITLISAAFNSRDQQTTPISSAEETFEGILLNLNITSVEDTASSVEMETYLEIDGIVRENRNPECRIRLARRRKRG